MHFLRAAKREAAGGLMRAPCPVRPDPSQKV